MISGGGSGLEWAGSARGVFTIVAVVRWGHGSMEMCYVIVLYWGVVSWKGFGQYLETCLKKGPPVCLNIFET